MRAISTAVFSMMLAAATACGGGGEAGHERGACYTNHTCEAGLVCLSDLCVAPAPVACTDVGDKLASFKVGNYAAREDRAKLTADMVGMCDAARLTRDEGKCILEAGSKFELSKCPRPLLPEAIELTKDTTGCVTVAGKLEEQARTELLKNAQPDDPMVKAIPQIVAAAQTACVEDKWATEVKGCIADAGPREMDACFTKLTTEQRDSLTKRIGAVMGQPPQ
ncbi:MAG: hypothetical protein K8W52_26370 [Deltaproteobacteria bacterium]|nr:hypothetical protein [Deltaproteobacteria bacterium]